MCNVTYLYQFLYFLTPTLANFNAVQIKIKVTLTEATSVHLLDFSPPSISKYSAALLSIQSFPDCIDSGDCPD